MMRKLRNEFIAVLDENHPSFFSIYPSRFEFLSILRCLRNEEALVKRA